MTVTIINSNCDVLGVLHIQLSCSVSITRKIIDYWIDFYAGKCWTFWTANLIMLIIISTSVMVTITISFLCP